MKPFVHAVIALLIISSPLVTASDWKRVSETPADEKFPAAVTEYDASSMIRAGSYVTVWERETFETPAFYSEDRPDVKKVMRQKVFDCRARTARILSRIMYNSAGDSVLRSDEPYDLAAIVPDSQGEEFLKIYCRTSSARKKS